MTRLMSRPVLVALALVLQLALLAVAVWPQLSARLTGTRYRLAVGPVDPIDPFRGAYVMLAYPGLPAASNLRPGRVYVPLAPDGTLWKGTGIVTRRPAAPPYLSCETRGEGPLSCGIDSLFLPEDAARRTQDELGADRAAAVVRVDAQGNAAVVAIEPR
ncbi:GDYXXLXY domain-containing protein [Sphaerisporangium aureirubrum]|uniref:GDYXXLXY domain-containing protein n=1 Tax=Sphaerisporangium aureirubrum TaxID=1544736 RepID=A0ABW1NDD9_9ACTN